MTIPEIKNQSCGQINISKFKQSEEISITFPTGIAILHSRNFPEILPKMIDSRIEICTQKMYQRF